MTLRRIVLGDIRPDGDADVMVAVLVNVMRDLAAAYGTVTPGELLHRFNEAGDMDYN